jgi:hypothetical protein
MSCTPGRCGISIPPPATTAICPRGSRCAWATGWQVGPPFGQDLVLVSLARAPFGADQQPGEESVDAYRARLQQRMQGASGDPVRVFARVVETRAR